MPNEVKIPSFAPLKANSGMLLDDLFARGRYANDASTHQMTPHAVVPETLADVEAALDFARAEGLVVLPRGGGTSQCGQTVNHAIVIDNSKHLNRILELDVEGRRCVVEPGIVLDELNRQLKLHGLWFPVDVSTSSRATIGGMAGNNSYGGRSIRYGMMRAVVTAIDAIMADGSRSRLPIWKPQAEVCWLIYCPDCWPWGLIMQAIFLKAFQKAAVLVAANIDALMPDAMALRPGGAAVTGSTWHIFLSDRKERLPTVPRLS